MILTRLGRKRKLTSIRRKVRVSEFEIFREINVVNSKSSNILCPSYNIIRTVRLIYSLEMRGIEFKFL